MSVPYLPAISSPSRSRQPSSAHSSPSHLTGRQRKNPHSGYQERLAECLSTPGAGEWISKVDDSASSSLTPLSSHDQLVPESSPKLSSLDREIESLAFGTPCPTPHPASIQSLDRILCSVPSSRPEHSITRLFTPAAANANEHFRSFEEPPAAQPRNNSFFLDTQVFETEDAGSDSGPPPYDACSREAERCPSAPDRDERPFAQQSQLRSLFEDSQEEEEPQSNGLVPISSAFRADNVSMKRSSLRGPRAVTNADLDNYPRLTFTSCSTPSPTKGISGAKPRKLATNKAGVTRSKQLRQLKRFPAKLKPINRSPLKFRTESKEENKGPRVHIEFERREAVQLLSHLKKRRRSSLTHEPLPHWPFTPSKDRENIQTPPLPSSSNDGRRRRSRNPKVSRLHFSRKLAKVEPSSTPSQAPSRVFNSCPSESASNATRNIDSLCGTASLRRYKAPPLPSLPSGMSDPPPLDIDQEIDMWEEESERGPAREMTPPDEIQEEMASWGGVPNENQPAVPSESPSKSRHAPATRTVLGDITSQVVQAPAPSLSVVDLTSHLMALAERLEPVRTLPRRRHQAHTSEPLKPPHRTVRSSSFTANIPPGRGAVPKTQPPPVRAESSSQLVLRPSTAPGRRGGSKPPRESARPTESPSPSALRKPAPAVPASRVNRGSLEGVYTATTPRRSSRIRSQQAGNGGVWSEFKQPSRIDASPPPEPTEVDKRHAELAQKFASFAAYLQQHEEPAPRPPALGTRSRAPPLRATRSVGHTAEQRPEKLGRNATQGPVRGPM